MLVFWIIVGLLAALVSWAAWRQRRYGGTKPFDPYNIDAVDYHHSSSNPWGLGNEAHKKDPD